MTTAECVGLAISALSALGTVAAALAATASLISARRSNETAERLVRLEESRRLEELRPRFDAKLKRQPTGDVSLILALVGPSELLRLDSVTIYTRGDGLDWRPYTPHDRLAEVECYAWGPAQFRLGIDGSVSRTESASLPAVEQGTEVAVAVEASTAPPWWNQAAWTNRYKTQPMRISLVCKRGSDEWVVHANVPATMLYSPTGLVTETQASEGETGN